MNNYTFRELYDIVMATNTINFIDLVKYTFGLTYGEDNFDNNICIYFRDNVFSNGLHVFNKTIINKSIDNTTIKGNMLPLIFSDAIWEFQSRMKFNMYSTKLDDLNKKISSLSTTSENVSTNKFYENNNIKDNEGNWNSPQFLNRSESSDNNNNVKGSSETTGELAKYLKDLQTVNWEISRLAREIRNNLIAILSCPFDDDDEYVDNIPNIWKYD